MPNVSRAAIATAIKRMTISVPENTTGPPFVQQAIVGQEGAGRGRHPRLFGMSSLVKGGSSYVGWRRFRERPAILPGDAVIAAARSDW